MLSVFQICLHWEAARVPLCRGTFKETLCEDNTILWILTLCWCVSVRWRNYAKRDGSSMVQHRNQW